MVANVTALLKKWWFWLLVLSTSAIPTKQFWGATGNHWFCGVPFSFWYVKRGNMGDGGTIAEGFLYIPDGSPPNGLYRTGWFIQPDPISALLNIGCWLLFVYGVALVWRRFRDARQTG